MRELTRVEEMFLAMDAGPTVGHSGVMFLFDASAAEGGEISTEAINAQLAERLPHILPMRAQLGPAASGHRLVEAQAVDLAHHVREARVAPPGRSRELARLASELNSTPLDRDRPLWEMHVMRGTPADRLAVLFKLHHAVIDGIGMQDMWRRLLGPAAQAQAPALVPREQGLQAAVEDHGPAAEPPPVPWTRFNQPLCGERDFAFASLDAAPVDAARKAADATFTEALLAVVAGGLRSWLADRGELPAEPLVTSVPASTRSRDETVLEGNRLRVVTLPLPTDEPDPARRVVAARDALRAARRRERDPARARVPARGPGAVNNVAVAALARPPVPLALCGAPLVSSYALTLLGPAGLHIGCNTTPGLINLGVHVDRRQGDGAWSIVAALETSADELELALA